MEIKKITLFGDSIYMLKDNDYLVAVTNSINEIEARFKVAQESLIFTDNGFEMIELQLREFEAGSRKVFDLPIKWTGTPFEIQVYKSLSLIKHGALISYQALSYNAFGMDKTRAVANAVGKNPILFVIPCHRVIGIRGALTGFSSGMQLKRDLLNLEGHDITNDCVVGFYKK